MAIPSFLRPLLRFGTGVAIQITGAKGAEALDIAAVRVRPSGAKLLANYTVEDFFNQPAGVWGTEYTAFLKQQGIPQVAATVVLPRQDVIVRLLSLPGVADKDLDAAVGFQMDGLHPYNEDEVITSWSRLEGTGSVLCSIVRRELVERYITVFAEAGIKVRAFTNSAAVLYASQRLYQSAPGDSLAWQPTPNGGVEIYGESASKPLLSSIFSGDPGRAAALASAELRFEQAPPLSSFEALVGVAPPVAFAAGLTAACPRLGLDINLLPKGMRQNNSPMAWVPSAALGVVVLALAGGLAAFPRIEESQEKKTLERELAGVQPAVTRVANLDKQISDTQKRSAALDAFRKRSKADMDAIAELTKLLPPPNWLNMLEVNEKQIQISGEAEQAAPLLKVIDSSPLFSGSEFNAAPMRIPTGEAFRIRTNREIPLGAAR